MATKPPAKTKAAPAKRTAKAVAPKEPAPRAKRKPGRPKILAPGQKVSSRIPLPTDALYPARTADGRRAADPGDAKYVTLTPLVLTGFLAALAQCGRPTKVARDMCLNYPMLTDLKAADEEFRKGWAKAMANAYDGFEDEARRRAFSGYDRPVFQMGQQVGSTREYSDSLAMMMLKAGKPEDYNQVSKVETQGSLSLAGGLALQTRELDDEALNKAINAKLAFLGYLKADGTKPS